jgi:hypothetical protein
VRVALTDLQWLMPPKHFRERLGNSAVFDAIGGDAQRERSDGG